MRGNILEITFTVVLVERGCGWLFAGRCFVWPVRAVDEEEVLIAVVIVIKETDAAAHRFGQQLFAGGTVVVDEVNAGGGSDVSELCFGRFGGRGCRGGGRCVRYRRLGQG